MLTETLLWVVWQWFVSKWRSSTEYNKEAEDIGEVGTAKLLSQQKQWHFLLRKKGDDPFLSRSCTSPLFITCLVNFYYTGQISLIWKSDSEKRWDPKPFKLWYDHHQWEIPCHGNLLLDKIIKNSVNYFRKGSVSVISCLSGIFKTLGLISSTTHIYYLKLCLGFMYKVHMKDNDFYV